MVIDISSVNVGARYRKDLGDLDAPDDVRTALCPPAAIVDRRTAPIVTTDDIGW